MNSHIKEGFLIDLGTMAYKQALSIQNFFHLKVSTHELPLVVLSVEHPAVVTLGRHASKQDILDTDYLKRKDVAIIQTDRGGEVTAHMPGQLVIYPILPLSALGIGARDYVCILQKIVISVLASNAIAAKCHASRPGVWVGDSKICSIGVRIKQRVSMHGLALNVSNDLALFQTIVPCGLPEIQSTRMADLIKPTPTLLELSTAIVSLLSKELGCKILKHSANALLPMEI